MPELRLLHHHGLPIDGHVHVLQCIIECPPWRRDCLCLAEASKGQGTHWVAGYPLVCLASVAKDLAWCSQRDHDSRRSPAIARCVDFLAVLACGGPVGCNGCRLRPGCKSGLLIHAMQQHVRRTPEQRLTRVRAHLLPGSPAAVPVAVGTKEQDGIVALGNHIRTVAPEEISEELLPTLETLGLVQNCRELAARGWTIVQNAASAEFVARLRETTLRLAGDAGYGAGAVYSALSKDDVYAEAALNPKVAAMAEFSVGRGNLIFNLIGR